MRRFPPLLVFVFGASRRCSAVQKKAAVSAAVQIKNAGHIKLDKDLDALRDRDDFKKLLAERDAKK